MFRDSARLQRQASDARLTTAMNAYRGAAQAWFDGTPDSVDRRIEACRNIQHAVRSAAASQDLARSAAHMRVLAELESDMAALQGVRHDLLTGCSDRQASRAPAGRSSIRLTEADQRWVDLTVPKFIRANHDVVGDREEIVSRAANFALAATSTAPARRAMKVSRAFVAAVEHRAGREAAMRTASVSAMKPVQDFDPQLMFLS